MATRRIRTDGFIDPSIPNRAESPFGRFLPTSSNALKWSTGAKICGL
jgi:hypothetical protein